MFWVFITITFLTLCSEYSLESPPSHYVLGIQQNHLPHIMFWVFSRITSLTLCSGYSAESPPSHYVLGIQQNHLPHIMFWVFSRITSLTLCSGYSVVASPKGGYLMMETIFHILHIKISCGYSLESAPPHSVLGIQLNNLTHIMFWVFSRITSLTLCSVELPP